MEAGYVLDDATAEDGVVQGAPVEAGRQVDRFEIDGVQHGRLDEDLKDQAQFEAVGAGQRVVAEDDVKDVREGWQEYSPFSSFSGVMSEMALGRNGGRQNGEVCGSASGWCTMAVSRVRADIVSKKRQITSSRLVSSALQSLSRMSGVKCMRSISARARLP